MRPPFSRTLFLGALLAVTGCDQEMISLDSGTTSSLTVRAYVDANGNGTYDAGTDEGVASATITAAGPGGATTATTGADGVATFPALTPGGYELSIAGAAPTGTVLATATTPVVAAPFRGVALTAEFRYSLLAGSISGRLYRDDNESGEYEAEADLPAAGIELMLFEGAVAPEAPPESAAQGVAIRTTTTDADGTFSFDILRPGTYTLQVNPLETMDIVGGATQVVTVGAGVEVSLGVVFEGTLLISVADARNAPEGQTVTIQGIVTWHPTFDNRTYFLQDETGGLSTFDFNRPDIEIGDRIQITGTRGAFRGEVQVSPILTLENLGIAGEPDPRQVTGMETNDGTVAGQLVTIDATVQSVEVQSFGTQRIILRDGTGTDFPVRADNRTGVTEDLWTVGEVFGVTGVVGTDDRDDLAHRIEVRSPADLAEGGSVVPIADARAMVGETVVVQGVITWQNQWDDRIFFFQDATGGLSSFFSGAPTLQRGDIVRIQGGISAFRGETQISPSSLQVLGNVAVPAPRGVTAAQINAGTAQGELVTITGILQTVEEVSFGSQNVTIRDGAGTDFSVFVDNRTGVSTGDWPAVGSTVRVTGVLGTDDRNDPAPRIELRDINDLVVGTAGQLSIAEARAMDGATVILEGVVTWQTEWDGRIYFFQDATAGISTFHSGAPDLNEGDRVRVTGEVSTFRGETQIGSITDLTVLGNEAVPTPRPVTGEQINHGLFQGELVVASGTLLTVTELSFGTQSVAVQDTGGTSFVVYVDNRTGMSAADWPALGSMVRVMGVLGTDDRNEPARLETRRPGDVTTIPATN